MSISSSGFWFQVSSQRRARSRGFSLVELVLFIAILGIAVAGVLIAYDFSARDSADPIVKKQALAIAESLLEEIQQMPFTYCDTDDANVSTATGAFVGAGGCATTVEAMGSEAGETRYSATTPFDNVNDYHGFSMNPIRDIGNNLIVGLALYTVDVTITPLALSPVVVTPTAPVVAAGESLLITVTVTAPGNITVNVDGYRTRYAPNL